MHFVLFSFILILIIKLHIFLDILKNNPPGNRYVVIYGTYLHLRQHDGVLSINKEEGEKILRYDLRKNWTIFKTQIMTNLTTNV